MKSKKVFVLLCLLIFFLGWLAGVAFQPEKVAAAKSGQYKVVVGGWDVNSARGLETILNTHASQGWKVHSIGPGEYVIFER